METEIRALKKKLNAETADPSSTVISESRDKAKVWYRNPVISLMGSFSIVRSLIDTVSVSNCSFFLPLTAQNTLAFLIKISIILHSISKNPFNQSLFSRKEKFVLVLNKLPTFLSKKLQICVFSSFFLLITLIQFIQKPEYAFCCY